MGKIADSLYNFWKVAVLPIKEQCENIANVLSQKANASHTHTAEQVGADATGAAAAVQANLNAHTDDTDNPHDVTAEQVGAIPATAKGASGGVAAQDEIAPVENGDAATAAHAEGEYIARNGLYYRVTADIATGDALTAGTNIEATTVAEALAALSTALSDKADAAESAEYPGCWYRNVNGAVEWLNPPLVVGVEYRTTERYLGKPVYTKAVNVGIVPAGGYMQIAHGIASAQCAFVAYGSLENGAQIPTAIWQNTTRLENLAVYANDTHITVSANADYSNHLGIVVIKCIKSTD